MTSILLSNSIVEAFGNITLGTVILYISAISAVIAILIKAYKIIIEKHDYVKNLLESFKKLQEEVNEMKDVQKVLTESMDKIMSHLEKIEKDLAKYSKDLDDYKTEFATIELNKLRDRIMQSYRYYSSIEKNPKQAWSEIEKEAFYNLLKDYYKLNGNGHVKSIIEPTVAAFTVISMNDHKGLTELMQSRR